MTSLVARRLTFKVAGIRIHPLAVVMALLIFLAAAAIALLPARGPADAATISLPPARAAALIQATSGDESIQMRAIGDQAKVINAARPSPAVVLSGRPFEVSGTSRHAGPACMNQAVIPSRV